MWCVLMFYVLCFIILVRHKNRKLVKNRMSKKTWTFSENAITLLFMEETFQNFLQL